jgi:hypothetical protein
MSDTRAMYFNADEIAFWICSGEPKQILTITESDLETALTRTTENPIEV